jgi:EAL domain-containing protein (putative c-di-GMP-specific phosphodiesterase class I)
MSMAAPAPQQFRLTAAELNDAFERDEFKLVFQPKVDLRTETATGVEAFVRWQHPRLGLLPPGLFLDFIEAEQRASDLTYFVMAQGMAAAAQWRKAGKPWALSLNVSPADLLDEEFGAHALHLARSHGLPPGAVIIETPERALAEDAESILATLDDLRAAGFQVALDGGGVVPVDLSQYQPVPFTSIKVGGQAMLRLAERLGLTGAGAITARLRFAHAESMEAVAVGVESEGTLARLKACGFTAAQGIWIQRPLPLKELLAWDGTWAREAALPAPKLEKPLAVAAAVPVTAPPAGAAAPQAAVQPPEKAKRTRLTPDALAKLKATQAAPLLDVVEDVAVSETGRAGAAAEACLPMAHLVQRKPRSAPPAQARSDASRRSSILDPIFG